MSAEIVTNRKARHDFHITETLEVGIELRGTEVKSIRAGKMNLLDAFARIEAGQVMLYGCDIQTYEKASFSQHDPRRPRRLLLHKREINRLFGVSQIKGNTLVALRAYWKGPHVKIELGVGKGKHAADRREDLKKKTDQREMAREISKFNRR